MGLYDEPNNRGKKTCFCHDGSIFPLLAVRQNNWKWVLFGTSEIHGMGDAEYKKRIIDDEFEEIVPLNSFMGRSYVAIQKNDKWGLLEINDNGTPECEWKMVCDFKYRNLDDLLETYKIETSMSKNAKKMP